MSESEDLSKLDPNDLSAFRLDELFIKHRGLGAGSLVIGGIEVLKDLNRYTSNSGKTGDWEIVFSFKTANGDVVRRVIGSRFSDNRSNDSERNWGLHE